MLYFPHPIFMNPALDCMLTTTFLPPASKMPAARMAPEREDRRRGRERKKRKMRRGYKRQR